MAVMGTALAGAAVVAAAAGAALPGHAAPVDSQVTLASDTDQRDGDRASRKDSRVAEYQLPAPDVWQLPILQYQITSPFGARWGKAHKGVDLGSKEGTPFYAAAAGTVTLCAWNGGYGNEVQITHGGGIVTIYGHSSKLLCKVGQKVKVGDQIALVGNTGHSFGAHLHFEVHVNDEAVEPTEFMKKHGVDLVNHAQAIYGDNISD